MGCQALTRSLNWTSFIMSDGLVLNPDFQSEAQLCAEPSHFSGWQLNISTRYKGGMPKVCN